MSYKCKLSWWCSYLNISLKVRCWKCSQIQFQRYQFSCPQTPLVWHAVCFADYSGSTIRIISPEMQCVIHYVLQPHIYFVLQYTLKLAPPPENPRSAPVHKTRTVSSHIYRGWNTWISKFKNQLCNFLPNQDLYLCCLLLLPSKGTLWSSYLPIFKSAVYYPVGETNRLEESIENQCKGIHCIEDFWDKLNCLCHYVLPALAVKCWAAGLHQRQLIRPGGFQKLSCTIASN